MAKNKGNIANLVPLTTDKAREIGALGGIKSGEVRREKKLMSQILADYLQKEHEVVLRDDEGNVVDREKVSASELIERTVTAIMARGDSASASMIKSLAEITEGKTVNLSGMVETASLTPEERKQRIAELEAKRK
jgi:coenzyme F420-reducing hydrogenase gamma subunit